MQFIRNLPDESLKQGRNASYVACNNPMKTHRFSKSSAIHLNNISTLVCC